MQAGDPDPAAKAARGLLRLLSNPTGYIRQVSETYTMADGNHVRQVTLLVSAVARHREGIEGYEPPRIDPQRRPAEFLYVDLIQPKKGELLDLRLQGDSEKVRRLDHVEHHRLAEYLILQRVLTILKGAVVPPEYRRAFRDEWKRILPKLTAIPTQSVEDALKSLGELFDPQTHLPVFIDRFP